jgi:tetratricopeptide (TPR) repeat protein
VPLVIEVAEQDFLDQLKAAKSDEEKISILKSAHASFPKNANFLDMLDKLLSSKGDYQGLVVIYKGVADSDPANIPALSNLSNYYIKLGQFDDALAMCQKIVDAGKADTAVYQRMAYIAGQKGDFNNRVAYLKKAIELDKKNETAILDLAKTYEQAGMSQEALDTYNSAETIATNKEILIPLIQEALKNKDYTKAEELLKRYVRRYPQDKNALAQLAMVMGKQGDSKSQAAYYQKALDLSPNNEVLWYNLGVSREKEGDQKGALDAYAKSLQIKPDDMDALMRAAALSYKLSQFKESYGYYNSLVKKTKKKEYTKGLINSAIGLKDPDKIIEAATQYLNKYKDYQVAITLAYAYESRAYTRDKDKKSKLDDVNKALGAYKTARSINPASNVAPDKIKELSVEAIKLRKAAE